MRRLTGHVRANAVAYLALFVALGGTGYAAVNLPPGSVGTRQLRNGAVTSSKLAPGSVTARKLDRRTIAGSIRDWAYVSEDGHVLGGSRGARVKGAGPVYYVSWGDRFPRWCAVLTSSPGREGSAPIADTIGVHVNEPGSARGATVLYVLPSDAGAAVSARFYVAVIC